MKKLIILSFTCVFAIGCNKHGNTFTVNGLRGITTMKFEEDSTVSLFNEWDSSRDTLRWSGSYAHGDTVLVENNHWFTSRFRIDGTEAVLLGLGKSFGIRLEGIDLTYKFYEDSFYTLEFIHPDMGYVLQSGSWSGSYENGDTLTTKSEYAEKAIRWSTYDNDRLHLIDSYLLE